MRKLILLLVVLVAGLVGMGQTRANRSPLAQQAGTSTARYRPCGLITSANGLTATTGANTNETVLWTYQLPAGVLGTNGDVLEIDAEWQAAATAGAKTGKLNFGASGSKLVATTASWTTTASGAGIARAQVRVTRVGAASQTIAGHMLFGNNDGSASSIRSLQRALTDDLTSAITIEATGTNGSAVAGEITIKSVNIRYCPNPT